MEEKEPNSTLDSHHQGDDDPKLDEEKESGGGETNSPLSHDSNQHFAEGDDKIDEDTSSIQPAVTENEVVEGINGRGECSDNIRVDGKGDIQMGREIKLEQGSEQNIVTTVHTEFNEKSSSSSSDSSSSSSSSDDGFKSINRILKGRNWEERSAASAPVDLREISGQPEIQTDESSEGVSSEDSFDWPTPVALPSRPVQATSCMGCCGLFEWFTGSNR